MIRKILEKTCRVKQFIIKKYITREGERQISRDLLGIRNDHKGRYHLAVRYIQKGDLVLDCACGIGYGSAIISANCQCSEITAIDKDSSAIKYALRYYNNAKVRYVKSDLFLINLPENYFNVVVSFETIEHVDGRAALEYFYKRLKNGGLLIASTPNEERMRFNKYDFPFHVHHYTPVEFQGIIEHSGFKLLHKFTQFDMNKEDMSDGWDGLFNIAVAVKK